MGLSTKSFSPFDFSHPYTNPLDEFPGKYEKATQVNNDFFNPALFLVLWYEIYMDITSTPSGELIPGINGFPVTTQVHHYEVARLSIVWGHW